MADNAVCKVCAHYPWKPEANPAMLPVARCHPDLPGKRWTGGTHEKPRDCALFVPVSDLVEVALETAPPSTASGGAGEQGKENEGGTPPGGELTGSGSAPDGDQDQGAAGADPTAQQAKEAATGTGDASGQPPKEEADKTATLAPAPAAEADLLDSMDFKTLQATAKGLQLSAAGNAVELRERIRAHKAGLAK
jgi:hypothetical protein